MNKKRALSLAREWAQGHRCTLRDGEASEYHAMFASMLEKSTPNKLLTLEQLREMDGPVWVACKPIEGGNGYWCLCQHGNIITPAGSIFNMKEIPHWVFYRRPPEGGYLHEDG